MNIKISDGTEIEVSEILTQKVFETYQELLFPNGMNPDAVSIDLKNSNKATRYLVRSLTSLDDVKIDQMQRSDFSKVAKACVEVLNGDDEKKSE